MATTKTPARKASSPTTRKTAVTKPAAKPGIVKKTATKKTVSQAAPAKPEKAKKDKLVRDSFTFPKSEYQLLDALKTRAIQLTHPVKKSELIRAGINALTAMNDKSFLAAIKAVPALKTGRPQKT